MVACLFAPIRHFLVAGAKDSERAAKGQGPDVGGMNQPLVDIPARTAIILGNKYTATGEFSPVTRRSLKMPDYVPMVRMSAFLPFASFIEHIGTPLGQQEPNSRLPFHLLDEPEALIPLRNAFQFLATVARHEGLVELGMVVGMRTQFQELGAFGRLVLQSVTLHDALTRVCGAIRLYNSAQKVWIENRGARSAVCTSYAPYQSEGWQFGEQYTLALLINCIRAAAGENWLPTEIHLEPTLFGMMHGKVNALGGFHARRSRVSCLIVDAALLSLPLHRRNGNATPDDYSVLVSNAPSLEFPGSIGQLARMFLGDEQGQINLVASAAGISVRTLQRRLANCGTDFSAIVDKARFDSAIDLMSDPKRDIAEIAFALGYNEASSFTRAFRRWTGSSPTEFRRMHEPVGTRS